MSESEKAPDGVTGWTRDKGMELRKIRKSAGLSQEALAERLGVDRTHVSKIENGVNGPSLRLLESWTAACGWTSRRAGSVALEEVQDAVRGMSDEDLEAVAAFARFWLSAPSEIRDRMRAFIMV